MVSAKGRRPIHLGIAVATLAIWACVIAGGDPPAADPRQLEVLESIADRAVAPTFDEFAESAHALEAATAELRQAVESPDVDDLEVDAARVQAQEAWRSAMSAWEVAEQMQLGPAGSSAVVIGGDDLRDEIYSWPSINNCRVDQELLAEEFDASDFTETRLVHAYGLDALEYLLFWDGPENACPPQLPINEDGAWDAISPDELISRRARYAASISAHLAATADALAERWSGEFADWLATPGSDASPYMTAEDAFDDVMRAMFYLDLQVKDEKIAVPAGLIGCAAEVCIDELEFVWAPMSKEAAVANLRGFRRLYLGGPTPQEGVGFDDLLLDLGEDQLAAAVLAETDAAIGSLEALEGNFRDVLLADEAGLDDVHVALKRLTDLLKGDFASVLMLTIPSEGAGDAD